MTRSPWVPVTIEIGGRPVAALARMLHPDDPRLTAPEARALLILRQHAADMPVTVAEAAVWLGYASTGRTHHCLEALETAGYMTHEPRLGRTWRLTPYG